MNKTLSALRWLVPLVLIAGCDTTPTPEPETSLRAMAAAAKDLADTLQSVQDADSAQAAAGDLDRKFTAFAKAYKGLQEVLALDQIKVIVLAEKEKFAPHFRNIEQDTMRTDSEGQRIDELPDLPVEFWKTYTLSKLSAVSAMVEMTLSDQDPNRRSIVQFFKDAQMLFRDRPYEEILEVQLLSTEAGLVQKACDRLQKLAPGATLYKTQLKDTETIIFIAPVKGFKAVASGVDFGTTVVKNESKRYLRIAPGSDEPDDSAEDARDDGETKRKESEDQAKRSAEEARRKQEEAQKQEEAERQRKEAEKKAADAAAAQQAEPNPNDPDYYDKLADLAASGDPAKSEKAVDVLLTKSPADVSSAETTKKIARAFKRLAENEGGASKEKAIKGLVIWAGTYSGPILLTMLKTPNPAAEEQIIDALGEIKYGPAATVLVTKLGDARLQERTVKALEQLGADAEDALIKATRSDNPQTVLAAFKLLGDCGTRKSLSVLNKGASSRNPDVRTACKDAAGKVRTRLKEAKDKAKDNAA